MIRLLPLRLTRQARRPLRLLPRRTLRLRRRTPTRLRWALSSQRLTLWLLLLRPPRVKPTLPPLLQQRLPAHPTPPPLRLTRLPAHPTLPPRLPALPPRLPALVPQLPRRLLRRRLLKRLVTRSRVCGSVLTRTWLLTRLRSRLTSPPTPTQRGPVISTSTPLTEPYVSGTVLHGKPVCLLRLLLPLRQAPLLPPRAKLTLRPLRLTLLPVHLTQPPLRLTQVPPRPMLRLLPRLHLRVKPTRPLRLLRRLRVKPTRPPLRLTLRPPSLPLRVSGLGLMRTLAVRTPKSGPTSPTTA